MNPNAKQATDHLLEAAVLHRELEVLYADRFASRADIAAHHANLRYAHKSAEIHSTLAVADELARIGLNR